MSGMKNIESIDHAIALLTTIVNWAESSLKIKRLDFNLVKAQDRELYEAALAYAHRAIKAGEISQDEFKRRLGID